jgi:hypothetical protein
MTISAPSQRILNGGRLVITSGIQNWVDTGVEPWASEPNPDTLGLDWRRHFVAVIITSHLSGDQGDTSSEDHELNREVYENPGCGGRLLTVWHRNGASKIFCITDDWGGSNAVTTLLFASEY